jgi:hypothetical protein
VQPLAGVQHSLPALPAGKAVCTKKFYDKAMKELAGGEQEQDEAAAMTQKWTSDCKDETKDSHTSMQILIDWWMEEGNYSRFLLLAV